MFQKKVEAKGGLWIGVGDICIGGNCLGPGLNGYEFAVGGVYGHESLF